jgi:hypothetical protein
MQHFKAKKMSHVPTFQSNTPFVVLILILLPAPMMPGGQAPGIKVWEIPILLFSTICRVIWLSV